jgi:hypothetical protein
MPPNNGRFYPGTARTLLHRAEELPADYNSTLRSSYAEPASHAEFFPAEAAPARDGRAARRLAAFRAVAEAESVDREAVRVAAKTVGSFSASQPDACPRHADATYAAQKASGKFKKSNAFLSNLAKPRTEAACPEATANGYLTAPAITSHSWTGVRAAPVAVSGDGNDTPEGRTTTASLVAPLRANFRKKEDALDYQGSQVWGHGKQGSCYETRGT